MKLVGIISDTHGLLRPEAVKALQSSDIILHAGDVGKAEVLDGLKAIAPVVAVRGNVDHAPIVRDLPKTAVVQVEEASFYILHDLAQLDLNPTAAGFHAVISGHSHHLSQERRGEVVYLNPGSAGPRRFRLPVSLARVYVNKAVIDIELIELDI